jgi:peptide-methionine (R)-S-oxide reductase
MSTSRSGFDTTPLPSDRVAALASDFTPEERHVILHQGTERPFCGLPLFASDAKFESGTGWPSFFQPFDPDHITEITDRNHGMVRVEIRCKRCDAHLGHVFDDGPPPTHQRHCLNSVSLSFVEAGQPLPLRS